MRLHKSPTQRERVLERLIAVGPRGVSPEDFLLPDVCDHGKPILRLAARVHELVEAGEDIKTTRDRNGVTRYVLATAPPPPPPAPKSAEPTTDDPAFQQSIFDVLDAA